MAFPFTHPTVFAGVVYKWLLCYVMLSSLYSEYKHQYKISLIPK